MFTLVATLHVCVALVLILLVLVQDSKGGAGGGLFSGGTSNSILGATGATNLLVKATRVCAVLFAATCIGLTVMTAQQSKSVLEGVVIPNQPKLPAPLDTPAQATPVKPADTKTETK